MVQYWFNCYEIKILLILTYVLNFIPTTVTHPLQSDEIFILVQLETPLQAVSHFIYHLNLVNSSVKTRARYEEILLSYGRLFNGAWRGNTKNCSGGYRRLQWFQLKPPLKERAPLISNDWYCKEQKLP